MKYKIGVAGSGSGDFSKETIAHARQIGKKIVSQGAILLTGSAGGLSYESVKGAKEVGGFTIGISPAINYVEHKEKYNLPSDHFDIIIFTGFGFKGRNVIFVRSSDAIIILGGGIGTLNEFTVAFDEDKIIGILTNTKGIADHIRKFLKDIQISVAKKIVYTTHPGSLIDCIFTLLKENC
ncbi:MAG TPA: hypothetical protein EYP60_01890 [bacterium (Candidatus Stahlbacteria)]|nr:hypothetical protein [Candidatus Stahlbacteria bacterium]